MELIYNTMKKKLLAAGIVVIIYTIGFIRGYNDGFANGMRTGEVKELVNQGFTVEDAEYIVENRNRMITTSEELFKKD